MPHSRKASNSSLSPGTGRGAPIRAATDSHEARAFYGSRKKERLLNRAIEAALRKQKAASK